MRGTALPAGTVVSTGAITGVHDVTLTSTSRVDYGTYGWFDVTYRPIKAVTANQGR
jgi:2-keto-4-pentenoate hydratase